MKSLIVKIFKNSRTPRYFAAIRLLFSKLGIKIIDLILPVVLALCGAALEGISIILLQPIIQ
ncbi:MAG: hypothetical protein ABH885_07660, partial [Candidatus Omnitrophota bacterium]